MFYKDSQDIYRVPAFEKFAWLVHGFGTRWSASLASEARVATLRQIHSDRVISAAGRAGSLGEGDALMENTPGSLVAVKTADCIPILVADPRNRGVQWNGIRTRLRTAYPMMRDQVILVPGDTFEVNASLDKSTRRRV